MSKPLAAPGQQSSKTSAKTSPSRTYTTFPSPRPPRPTLEDGARLSCAGCTGSIDGVLHVTAAEPPFPIVLCPDCAAIVAGAVRSKDPAQLDAAAQRLTVALYRRAGL